MISRKLKELLTNLPPKKLSDEGACGKAVADNRVNPDLWHPDGDVVRTTREAATWCHGCKVQMECLEYAMGAKDIRGVWGGVAFGMRGGKLREQAKQELLRGLKQEKEQAALFRTSRHQHISSIT